MELIFSELNVERILNGTAMQALIEGDIPLPDEQSKLSRVPEVLSASGSISLSDVTTGDSCVIVNGDVTADIICSDADDVFAFRSSASFSKTIPLEGAAAGMKTSANAVLQTLDVDKADGRLHLSATTDICCTLTDNEPFRVLSGIKGANDVELQFQELDFIENKPCGKLAMRVRDDIPSQGAQAILLCCAAASAHDAGTSGGKILVEGTVSYTALVRGRENRLSTNVYHVPFTTEAEPDIGMIKNPLIIKVNVEEKALRPIGDDTNLLCAEAVINIELFGCEEKQLLLPIDAYSPSMPFVCKYNELRMLQHGSMICGKQAIAESIAIPDGMPDISRIIHVGARSIVTSAVSIGYELRIEGFLFSKVIYQSDGGTLYSFSEDIPYLITLASPEENDCAADAQTQILFISPSGAGRTIDVTYNVGYCVSSRDEMILNAVCGIEECGACETRHGIVIYYAGNGETLFDVGKTFNVSRAQIANTNPSIKEELSEGQKIMMII